jgi:hypothetical protein
MDGLSRVFRFSATPHGEQNYHMDVVLDMDKKIARGEKFSTFVALLAQRDASKYHEHGGKDGICYKKKYRDLF